LNTHKKRESQGFMLNIYALPLALGSAQPFDLGRSPSSYLMVTLQKKFSKPAPRLTALQVRRFPAHMSAQPSLRLINLLYFQAVGLL
jgi:hypothetical protein